MTIILVSQPQEYLNYFSVN